MDNSAPDARQERILRLGKQRENLGRTYRQRCKEAFEGILQSFAELLESLRTSPQEDNEEQHSQLSAAAIRQKKMFTAQYASENIVRCAEALQVIATELRKHLLVHDHAKNIEETEKRTQELSELRTEMSETLSTFQHELSSHLRSMEEALYLSNEPDTFNE
eukprot:m.48410 g.48410  ORF g.48410 m.48410 type:complete len:162 (-) comp10566_c0_seq4:134-619(-)